MERQPSAPEQSGKIALSHTARKRLQKGIKVLFILALLFIAYILTDFSFNRPDPKSYQFTLPELAMNSPQLLKQDTLLIVIARYDQQTLSNFQAQYLSDSAQVIHDQKVPALQQGYFVAMGYGTLSGCPIEIREDYLQESCSGARYDMLGRSMNKQHFPDLRVPQYTFNHDFSLLTIE